MSQLIFIFVLVPIYFRQLKTKLKLHIHSLSNWKTNTIFFSYCSDCSWDSQGKNTDVVCHSLLQWTTFCQTSPPWPVHLGWLHMAWLSFTEIKKAVVHVIRLVSCLWLWFQSFCPLMPSLRAYHITWVSLTLDVGYLFMAAPAKHSHCSLPWMWGISSQLLLLNSTWGSSFRLLLRQMSAMSTSRWSSWF